MLYVIDFVLLIGCILIFSAGIVWAFRSEDYSKNPLHRLYCLLSMMYLRMSDFLMKGYDALRDGKEQLCSRMFGSGSVPLTTGGKTWSDESYMAGGGTAKTSGVMKNSRYNMKVLK